LLAEPVQRNKLTGFGDILADFNVLAANIHSKLLELVGVELVQSLVRDFAYRHGGSDLKAGSKLTDKSDTIRL